MTSKENMRKNNRSYYQRHKEEILKRRKAKREDYKNQLTKAEEIIRTLYFIIQGRIDYENNIQIKDSMDLAKAFLNEVK